MRRRECNAPMGGSRDVPDRSIADPRQSGKSSGIFSVAIVAASPSYCPASMQNSISCALVRWPASTAQVSADTPRVTTNSSVAVISARCRSVSPSASGPSKILACSSGVDAAGAGQPAVLLQLVLAVAQMTHAQDDQFGVLARQLADVEQIAGVRQPRQEQQPVLTERGEQVHLRDPDGAARRACRWPS